MVEVRGTVHWLTHKDGPARALHVDPGARARARLPRVLGETGKVVWVTDAAGPDALEIASVTGETGTVRRAEGAIGSVVNLAAAPDGTAVAAAANDGRLLVVDVESGQVTELAASDDGAVTGLSWSPDSAWLAWSQPGPRPLLADPHGPGRRPPGPAERGRRGDRRPVRRHRPGVHRRRPVPGVPVPPQRSGPAATGGQVNTVVPPGQQSEVVEVTDGRFADTDPVFTADGLYLAFLSVRSFNPVYDAQSFDLSFPFGSRPYLVPLAAHTPSPFGPLPEGRLVGAEPTTDNGEGTEPAQVDADGLPDRVVPVPVIEARYSGLRAVKGGLAWRRAQVTGVLGEGGADLDDDAPRPALERYDLRKREVTEIAREIDWFDVSGDGTRLVVHDRDELRVMPSSGKRDDAAETVTVNKSRARFQADPAALWRHAYAEAGRIMRRDFWVPDMSGVDWDGVLESYRPLLDRIRGSADFADLLWEVLGETGTSHSYVQQAPGAAPKHPPVGQLGADLSRDGAGRWLVDRVLPGESSDPRARSPLAAPGVAVRPGDEVVAVDGQPVDPVRGPWPLLAGTAGQPVELTVPARRRPGARRVVVVPLRNERRLRYQDWVAGRRALVRELSQGRLGYLHIPDMMGEGWAHFHRDLRTELSRDGLIFDVRANNGGHISQLVVEKLARRVIAWGLGRWQRPETYPLEARRGPMVTVADEFAGSDGNIVTAAIRLLGLGPVVGTRTWGGVIGIEGYQELVDGTSITVPQYAFSFMDFGWDVENYGVDPDVEVLNTPDDWAAGRDAQLETAVQLALEALDKQPPPVPPDPATGPVKARPPLPPRSPGLLRPDRWRRSPVRCPCAARERSR